MITKLGDTTFRYDVRSNKDFEPIDIEVSGVGIEVERDIIFWIDVIKAMVHVSKIDPSFKPMLKEIMGKI
jgi:hypothetical protein